jgi:hypothetical protein
MEFFQIMIVETLVCYGLFSYRGRSVFIFQKFKTIADSSRAFWLAWRTLCIELNKSLAVFSLNGVGLFLVRKPITKSAVYTADTSRIDRKMSGELPERIQIREDKRTPKFDASILQVSKVYSGNPDLPINLLCNISRGMSSSSSIRQLKTSSVNGKAQAYSSF